MLLRKQVKVVSRYGLLLIEVEKRLISGGNLGCGYVFVVGYFIYEVGRQLTVMCFSYILTWDLWMRIVVLNASPSFRSQSFQRFAVKTSKKIDSISNLGK